MEGYGVEQNASTIMENDNKSENESATNFQKFIYDLFEKNGILNDLRAYLRGHIIDVLKSAQTGEPPTCQKNFTQRLELSYQAMNMLIAEYLLRLDFSYSLSVFVSEVPLANMVFEFAKRLMQNSNGDYENLKFKESDVWSILNYLGVKCDSKYASNIIELYKKENLPLIMCILKCSPLFQRESKSTLIDQGNISDNSSSSMKSIGSLEKDRNRRSTSKTVSAHDQCRHQAFCKICQSKENIMKETYRNKKKQITKNIKTMDFKQINLKMLMRNMGEMEQSFIDEMFQEIKSVYETEVDIMRQNEEKKIKRSLASHALQLQRQKEEMEESFKNREAELERNVQEKKKFLWELARSLREQHAQMSRAMHAVRHETDRLTAKEDSLKTQLAEAELVLKSRGEEMRSQIANELVVLEDHLESMKKERESINKERSELEQFKITCNNNNVLKAHDMSNDDLRPHYDLLKDELKILKKYLETTKLEPKCVIERSTLTELSDVTSKLNIALNNEQDADRYPLKSESDDRIRTPHKVINELKKQKNVNFRTSNFDELYRSNRDRSRSRSSSSEAGDTKEISRDQDLVERLRDENERLRIFAAQQREHIDELSSHQARLQAELAAARFREYPAPATSRPRTAPSVMPYPGYTQYRLEVSPSAKSVGWRKGAGEEMSIFANAQPRILIPGDTLPFIGVLKDRHGDSRRHLINQWHTLRRRVSPIGVTKLRSATSNVDKSPTDKSAATNAPRETSTARQTPDDTTYTLINDNFAAQPLECEQDQVGTSFAEAHQPREKNPKSVLREAKEILKKDHPAQASSTRDKSPNSVLREAKMRLRKLEIEAEAVEKSYLDFRRRQQLKQGKEDGVENIKVPDLYKSSSQYRYDEIRKKIEPRLALNETPSPVRTKDYMNDYKTKLNTMSYFRNRIASIGNAQPIPPTLANIESELKQSDERRDYYLETPLIEFRKLYHSQKFVSEKSLDCKSSIHKPKQHDETPINDDNNVLDFTETINVVLKNKKDELKILNDNTKKCLDKIEPIEGSIDDIDALKRDNNNKEPENTSAKKALIDEIEHLSVDTLKIDNNIKEPENTSAKKALIDKIEQLIENQPKITQEPLLLVEQTIEAKEIELSKSDMGNENESKTTPELLVVVESTVETKEIDLSRTDVGNEKICTQMTIIVSPKLNANEENVFIGAEKSASPRKEEVLSGNDALNAIFHADTSKAHSSVEMELNIPKDITENDDERGGEDYPDDFSVDVDNYNSRTDYETNSPISLPKNSEEDNFWDTN